MPKMNFTAQGIASLKPPARGRIEFWDSTKGVPSGFGIRVSETGAMTWVTLYRSKGRVRRHTIGPYPALTLADARDKARVSLNAAANGGDPASDKKAERLADTFGELTETYLSKHASKKKDGGKEDARILNKDLLPRWRHLKAKEIMRKDVRFVLDGLVERDAPIYANRVLALVRKIFNFAISRDIVDSNPCAAIPLPAKPKSRDRVLSAGEIRKVWNATQQEDPLICGVLRLRLLTAQRGGEVLSMNWADIDLESRVWTIPASRAKNGISHRVPLNDLAVEVLKSLHSARGSSPWVFPSPVESGKKHIENIQKAIQRVRARPECTGIEFVGHDLRRTAASHMASAGVPRLVIGKILNHVEPGVTAVYDRHGYDKEKLDALNLWGMRLKNILSHQETNDRLKENERNETNLA